MRKPGIWDFFVKVEFDVWLISSTIELTCIQVSDRLCVSLWRYSALHTMYLRLRHTPNN